MPSTPFFFFLGIILFLTWFTTDVHSEKVLFGSKGSSVVLSPDDAKTSIIRITWKRGAPFIAEWFGGKPTFYFRCNDGCSLNTKTGNLTINDVKIEDGGEYTPEINGKILSAQKLQVFSPVPKPRITHDCNPEKTKCTLTCSFDRTDDLGDVEVFWILDDRREKGTELQITKETKEEMFICSLKNPVSSENSTELKNPLFSVHQKILSFSRGMNEQRSSAAEEQKGLNDESNTVVWKQTEMNGVTENTRGKTKQWIPNHHNTTRKTLWRHGSAQEVQHFKNGVKPSSDGWRRCSCKMESLEGLEPHKETIMESFSLN